MDILLLSLGLLASLLGVMGSFLPVLPGPPLSWLGLFMLHLTEAVPDHWLMLGVTLVIALAVLVLDYIIPALGAKRFGGGKAGMIGTIIGLLIAIVFPIFGFMGIVIWPFIGALAGEFVHNANSKTAVKAAFGSLVGFLAGTFLKFILAVVYLGIFIVKAWNYKEAIFSL